MQNEESNPWQTLNTNIGYENPWIKVQHNEVLNPSGKPGIYGVVHFKNLAIGVIPLDKDNNTWIVGQYRYALNQYSWEIPEGGGKIGVDPLDSAKRELLEECGLIAHKWEKIMEMHLSNSTTDEHSLVYVARDLEYTESEPEETEQLIIKKIPFEELYQMVKRGEVTDGISVAAVLKVKLMMAGL
jgi:8-oxo-dGTP pyrophosphatase MutT (NUDIX family)